MVVSYPHDRARNYAELLAYVTDRLPTHNPYVVLAESFSTPLAVKLAAQHPDNLRGLIICAGFVTNPARGWLRLLQPLAAPFLFRFGIPVAAVDHFLIGGDAPAELQQTVLRTIRSVPPEVIAARIRFVAGCDVRADLAKINVPTLYLQPTGDRLVTAHSLAEIRNAKPDVRAAQVAGPHFLLQREPRKAAELVAEFIRQHCV
jgi:pimeloyl-[acyl-carrier protein] methyl ester esterase